MSVASSWQNKDLPLLYLQQTARTDTLGHITYGAQTGLDARVGLEAASMHTDPTRITDDSQLAAVKVTKQES
jgi:hypothetical protein